MKALLVSPAACLTQQALSGLLAPFSVITRSYTAAQQQVLQLQQQQQEPSTQQPPATHSAQQQRSTVHDQQHHRLLMLPLQQQAAHSLWQLRGYTTGAAARQAAGQHDDDRQQQRLRPKLQQQVDHELLDADPQYVRRPRADSWRPGQRFDQQQQQQRWRPTSDSWRPHRQQQQQLRPEVITSKMMKVETPQQLAELVAQHSAALNRIHIVAALNKAAELWPNASTGTSGADSEMVLGRQQLQHLVKMLAGPFARTMTHHSSREISSGLWAYATCQIQPPQALLSAAADAVSSWDKLQGGEAKHLITLGWSLAKFNCKDRQVFAALAAALAPQVLQLSANQVSVVLWAFGRSAYRDEHLLRQLASRARELLHDQLQQKQQQQKQQQQQGQQLEADLGRAAARQQKLLQFNSRSLSNTVWGLSALNFPDAQVVAAAASLAAAAPLVYEFRPYDAVNLLKGFATAAEAQGDDGGNVSSTGSSSGSDAGVAVSDETGEAAAAAAASDRELAVKLWPAACAVASAALRRLDEATMQCVLRMMSSVAALHKAAAHPQQGSLLSAAATQEGRVVFGQLAAALHSQWSSQAPNHPISLAVTAWAFVAAQESGLLPALLLQDSSKPGDAATTHAAAVLQQLLQATVVVMTKGLQEQQLKVHQVADVAAAFDRLCRPLQSSSSSSDKFAVLSFGTSSSAAVANPAAAAEDPAAAVAEPGADLGAAEPAAAPAAADLAAADSAAADPAAAAAAGSASQGAESQALLGQFAAAVAAVADAAQQLAAGAAPGQMGNRDAVNEVSRMLAAFGRMQVTNAALYQALLRHWTPQHLQACSNESLVGAARAATWLVVAQPGLISSGVFSVELWEQLLQLCLKRWPRLNVEQRAALQPVCAKMPARVAAQYPDGAAEFTRVVAGA